MSNWHQIHKLEDFKTMRLIQFLVVLLPFVGLVACLPSPTPLPPLPTETRLPTETAAPTTVWFPPTATPSPFPTPVITPTVDLRPQLGGVIFQDDFTNPSLWTLGQTASSSVAMGNNKLSLVLNQPGGYLFSLRQEPILDDFYLEITANTSLCRGTDEYGMLLRVTPGLEFYRFSLSCDGQVRLDKYYQGRASSPQPWSMSGAVPPGAPSKSRLAVWAKDKELLFYINDEYQFTVLDPSISEGSLGAFIRSDGDNTVSISFSDLLVHQVP